MRSGPRDEYVAALTGAGGAAAQYGRIRRHEVYRGVFDLELLRQAVIAVLPAGTGPDPGVPEAELVLSGRSGP
ncbi:hypothetical protein [Streptomyces sp. NPDC059564]|uniref:hypothetical protein n=1 Tax=Streptomyces sp. NPDC059564 TaxID=3346865 RepID=UPI0036A3649F